MSKNFSELSATIKQNWSDEAHALYEVVSAQLQTEIRERSELGAALAQARKEKSLSQPELSRLTAIQQSEISRIERGVGNPTADTLLKLTKALDYKIVLMPAV